LFRPAWRSAHDIDEYDGQVEPAKRIDEGAGLRDHIRNGMDERRTDDALLKVDDDQSGFGVERREGHMDLLKTISVSDWLSTIGKVKGIRFLAVIS
jgi:hypothetical protein